MCLTGGLQVGWGDWEATQVAHTSSLERTPRARHLPLPKHGPIGTSLANGTLPTRDTAPRKGTPS